MNEESLTGTSSLYSSTFAQVIFVNVEKQYMTDVAVKCNYTLTPRITPHKNDWIGIFKVGWSTARDYHTFVWAPLPKEVGQVERQQQVTFEAYYLPKDDNDFYQFCYVTQKGEIRGASTPFGFRLANSNTPDQLESDSGQEMLVITTQEKLEETEREKDELREDNQRLTTENAALKVKIKELETQAAREKEEHCAALKVNQKAVLELEKQVLEQKLKSEFELKAQSEKEEQLRKVLNEREAACLSVQTEKQDLLAKVESAQSSVEQLKQKNEKAAEKLKRLRVEISAKEAELTSLAEAKNKSASELKAAQERLQLVQLEFETQKEENVALKEELMKLAMVQNEQQNCLAEISQLRQALSKSEELKASNANTVEKLQEQVGHLQQCLKDMEEQVKSAQQQQVQTVAELMVTQAGQEQSQKSLCEAQQEIRHWKYKFEKVDEIFSKNEGKCADLARELDVKTRALGDRDAEVAALQEEIERLTEQIDKLRPSTSHQSGAFKLEHTNPYSMTVPTAHSAHPELLFGNPYFERGVTESLADQYVDLQQDLNALENSRVVEEDLSLISQKCPVCLFPFDPATDESVMEQHIATHFGHDCPVCLEHFPENEQTQYAQHVQAHFAASR